MADPVEPDTAATESQAAVAVPEDGIPILVVTRGANAGSRYAVRHGLQIGRHPDSDIFLDDVTVSRRHAEVVAAGTGFEIRDVGSLNGTYVNGDRIEAALLGEGDTVQVGKYRLIYVTGVDDAGR